MPKIDRHVDLGHCCACRLESTTGGLPPCHTCRISPPLLHRLIRINNSRLAPMSHMLSCVWRVRSLKGPRSLAKTSAPCCRDGHSGVALLTAEAAPQVAHCGSLRNRAILTVPDLASRAIHVGMSCVPLVHNSILPELLSRAPLLIFDPQVACSDSLCSTSQTHCSQPGIHKSLSVPMVATHPVFSILLPVQLVISRRPLPHCCPVIFCC